MTDRSGQGQPIASNKDMLRLRSEGPGHRKKQRKQRPCYSCEECRRLKMKCDRQVPCSNCVRRHRVEYCDGTTISKSPSRGESNSGLQENAGQAQQPPPSVQDISPAYLDFDHPHIQQEQQTHQLNPSQRWPHDQTIIAPLMHSNQGNPDGADPLALLARTLEADTVQVPAPHSASPMPSGGMAGSLHSVPSGASGSSNPASQPALVGEPSGSYGTLMLSDGGRSKYLGPTAGSEWLKDSETQDVSDTPLVTRAPSPELPQAPVSSQSSRLTFGTAPIAFPFNGSAAHISTRDLLSRLPAREEAWTLAESYYRYCAWHHDVAPKSQFEKVFNRVYTLSDGGSLSRPVNHQEIALVFIIMAQGTMFNIEMPHYDPSAEDWLHLSEWALVKGDFLSNNMVPGLQTLHLMAHLHLQLDKGRRGDNAWPLWGLVMRLAQAMGMHRDGARWNLPQDVVEERRKVFWECNAADTFQAHCFSRPCSINPQHCDTAFPSEPLNPNGEKSYTIVRFELSQLSSEILNMAMNVRKPAYSAVIDLDFRLCEFERNLPFSLRCRAAFLSMPSRYPQFEAAIEASPEPSRRSMTISFQQTNLALNISETIINLHRPYYAKALYDDIDDRVKSVYAPSFLTVIERCALIINIVTDIHIRFPAVSTRQWNFWYHVFGSALCLGTLALRDPGNAMATFVLAQIDAAIVLFTSLIQHGASTPRYNRNLQWLLKLRARVSTKISAASTLQKVDSQRDADPDQRRRSEDREQGEDLELLGWRTRLIERAGQDRQTIRTIRIISTTTGPHITNISNSPPNENDLESPQNQLRIGEFMSPSTLLPGVTPDSTYDLLHDFWDPMLLQDIFETPHNQPNPFMDSGSAWWDNTARDVTQA